MNNNTKKILIIASIVLMLCIIFSLIAAIVYILGSSQVGTNAISGITNLLVSLTPTPTQTLTSTATLTPTATRTPAPTSTSTLIPTETVEPTKSEITYDFDDRCIEINIKSSPKLILYECVVSITVRPDETMQFNFEWRVVSDDNQGVRVYPDTGNRNMYITDSLGNRIDHIETGGDANEAINIGNGGAKVGWFLFPPPDPQATHFIFHDDDNGYVTEIIPKDW